MRSPLPPRIPLLTVLLGSCTPTSPPVAHPEATSAQAAAVRPSGANGSWFATVQTRIAAEARAIHPRDGAFVADLPALGLTARLDEDRVAVFGAEGEAFSLHTSNWGRAGELSPVGARTPFQGDCTPSVDAQGECVQRLEYADSTLTEWWIGLGTGLEQGWTLDVPPDGEGPLLVYVAIEGALAIDGQGEDVAITDATGQAWSVAEVSAWDANGDPLAAQVFATTGALRIEVDDAGAVYPIEVDPVYTTAGWTATGTTGNAPFGVSVSGGGDVNGDGYDDVIVGADLYGLGHVYAYLGSSTGISTTPASTIIGPAEESFGDPVAMAGDVNGDGYDDILVGALWYRGGSGQVSVYLGSAVGLDTAPAISLLGTAGERFGDSLGAAGDVNADGYDDVIVGAYAYDSNTGRAVLYEGSPAGITSTPATILSGGAPSDFFGVSVGGLGDVNGDGYDDVVVGTYAGGGQAAVYLGSSVGLAATATTTLNGEDASDGFGTSVAPAGDVNGDGYDDVLVGANAANSGAGAAYVYTGSSRGVASTPAIALYGEASSGFGYSLGSGDVNGDGYDDIVVGAYRYPSFTYTGRVDVYLGSSVGLSGVAASTMVGEAAGDSFGYSLSGAGDVNGDGYDDVIIAAEGYDSSTGRTYVYSGSSGGLGATASTTLTGVTSSDELGYAVAGVGDVDGDGYDDVIVSAYQYDAYTGRVYVYTGGATGLSSSATTTMTGEAPDDTFGASVSAAGDVNGDGYADVIVGASRARSFIGCAYVYHGSSAGLSGTASSTLVGEAGLYFGWAVSGAGDVDGDGYDDVVVGDWYYSLSTGRAYVYSGSPSGVRSTASTTLEGGGYFGRAVSDAGDVNGDGYADVVVSAPYDPPHGSVFVYLGSAAGLSSTAAMSIAGDGVHGDFGGSVAAAGDVDGDGYGDVVVGADGSGVNASAAYVYAGGSTGLSATAMTTVVSTDVSESVGCSVSGAGDLDGDGYADVIIGAYGYDSRAGRAYLYSGSSAGLSSTPSTTLTGEAQGDGFGYSVSGAGDVNGDGRGDVIVGAPFRDASGGRTYVFLGAMDADADGISDEFDCDDADAAVGAGLSLHADLDGDTFGSAASVNVCGATAGYVEDATDCDDTDPAVHPGATEVCDPENVDEDCDGLGDDASATGQGSWYADADGDLYGSGAATVACDPPADSSDNDSDCDDTDASVHPGAVEVASDGTDQDCDGEELCFVDNDDDGFRPDETSTVRSANPECHGSGLAVATDAVGDCDDTDSSVFPGAAEIPRDGVDQDCDGDDAEGVARDDGAEAVGCGCASARGAGSWISGLALLGVGLRRRRTGR